MGKYIKLFENHNGYTAYTADTENFILPNVSYCKQENEVHYNKLEPPHDYSQDYLTFRATQSGTFKLSGNSVNYSLDSGETWTELASDTDAPTVTSGNTIMFKAELTPTRNGIGRFSSTANFEVEGNPMSLLYGDDFREQYSLSGKDYAFKFLFSGCSNLVSAENLSLVANILSTSAYTAMFSGCTSLTTAPSILPSTTLTNYCYQMMFQKCTSLTTAPKLPAETLVHGCYNYMFSGCTNLNYIKAMFTTEPSTTYTNSWLYGVAENGTFVKNSAATWNVSGGHGVPYEWTIETASS